MTQKEIKEKYMNVIRTEVWPNSNNMQAFSEKEFYYGVELANDDIFIIDRPRIHKDFCFGYGMNGVCDDDDMYRACNAAENAKTNENYFIQENLKNINAILDRLTDPRFEAYKYCAYSGQQSGSKLKTYKLCDSWDNPDHDPSRWNRLVDVEKMTRDEIKALIDGYGVVKGMFTKRLNTYLKRYGLSKVNTWTYLRD